MNLNKVFLLGRLTADPQLRTTQSGQQVANFGIATNRVWTDKAGNRQEEAEFHNVVVWGRQAEVATQFLVKGSLAFVEGRLRTRAWQTQQGENRRTTEIVADRIQLGPRPSGFPRNKPGEISDSQSSAQKPGVQADPPAAPEVPVVDLEAEEKEVKPGDMPF